MIFSNEIYTYLIIYYNKYIKTIKQEIKKILIFGFSQYFGSFSLVYSLFILFLIINYLFCLGGIFTDWLLDILCILFPLAKTFV